MPDLNEHWLPGPCAEYEELILDRHHRQLAEPARRQVEAHLAACPACRQLAGELAALDAALTAQFQRKELPASFKETLFRRIDAQPAGGAPGTVVERKRALESEFQRQSAGLLRRVLRERLNSILDGFGILGLALVAGAILQPVARQGFDFSAALQKAAAEPTVIYSCWAAAAAFVAGAVWFGLQPAARRALR